MSKKMFSRSLNLNVVREIGEYFTVFKNVADIKYESIDGMSIGSFASQITDDEAKQLCHESSMCFVAESEYSPSGEPSLFKEYIVYLIEIPAGVQSVLVRQWKSDGVGLFSVAVACFDNRLSGKQDIIFPVLIPRVHNNRGSEVGLIVTKAGYEICIEFRKDGKIIPGRN